MGDLIASLGFQPLAGILSSDFLLEVVTANYLQLLLSLLGQPDMLTLGVWLTNGIYGNQRSGKYGHHVRGTLRGIPVYICILSKSSQLQDCVPQKEPQRENNQYNKK